MRFFIFVLVMLVFASSVFATTLEKNIMTVENCHKLDVTVERLFGHDGYSLNCKYNNPASRDGIDVWYCDCADTNFTLKLLSDDAVPVNGMYTDIYRIRVNFSSFDYNEYWTGFNFRDQGKLWNASVIDVGFVPLPKCEQTFNIVRPNMNVVQVNKTVVVERNYTTKVYQCVQNDSLVQMWVDAAKNQKALLDNETLKEADVQKRSDEYKSANYKLWAALLVVSGILIVLFLYELWKLIF